MSGREAALRAGERPLVTSILIEHQVDAGRDPLIEITGAEISAHRVVDFLERTRREEGLRRALAHDGVLLLGLRKIEEHAVDLLFYERVLNRLVQRLAPERRLGHDDDFFSGLALEIADFAIEVGDRRRAEQRGAVFDVPGTRPRRQRRRYDERTQRDSPQNFYEFPGRVPVADYPRSAGRFLRVWCAAA